MTNKKIGLISGGGAYPIFFAREAKKLGYDVFIIGLNGITPKQIEFYAKEIKYFKLGQISDPVNFLKDNNVDKVLMAGNVPHVSIFGGNISPDFRAAKLLFRLKNKKTNSILGAIADELKKDNLELINSATFLDHLLPKRGFLTSLKPAKNQDKDVKFGWKVAKIMADMDIGLTVVIRDETVVAVEAMEGTDNCIIRAGNVFHKINADKKNPRKTMVVVKVARPNQDMRFDLPVIGIKTLEIMKKAGANVLAIESRKTLILEKELFIKKANEFNITVQAINPADMLF
ncbi:MAG: UDP-2,3-diacylglucosamine diphosphatase LpxI [Elusimicrobiota bacterium]|nr:UDP-2,3-diacylglucosamine diphosphatase LpxI [Elusimicrobiota bacterium]